MERRALVVALALTVPLMLYGIPYAYAATQSTYVVNGAVTITGPGDSTFTKVMCFLSTDYPLHYGLYQPGFFSFTFTAPLDSSGNIAGNGGNLNGWELAVSTTHPTGTGVHVGVYILCQSAITVAGIGVPEFGSLYIAIALGAVVYFMLSRRYAGRPTTSSRNVAIESN